MTLNWHQHQTKILKNVSKSGCICRYLDTEIPYEITRAIRSKNLQEKKDFVILNKIYKTTWHLVEIAIKHPVGNKLIKDGAIWPYFCSWCPSCPWRSHLRIQKEVAQFGKTWVENSEKEELSSYIWWILASLYFSQLFHQVYYREKM